MWEWDGESLINYQHGKALTIGEAATAEKGLRNTAPAVIWPYIATDHQKVYMQKAKEGGVNIFWKHSNKALDVLANANINIRASYFILLFQLII